MEKSLQEYCLQTLSYISIEEITYAKTLHSKSRAEVTKNFAKYSNITWFTTVLTYLQRLLTKTTQLKRLTAIIRWRVYFRVPKKNRILKLWVLLEFSACLCFEIFAVHLVCPSPLQSVSVYSVTLIWDHVKLENTRWSPSHCWLYCLKPQMLWDVAAKVIKKLQNFTEEMPWISSIHAAISMHDHHMLLHWKNQILFRSPRCITRHRLPFTRKQETLLIDFVRESGCCSSPPDWLAIPAVNVL